MITDEQVDGLNSLVWSYKFSGSIIHHDLGCWQAQEYYSPKEWHLWATFKIGKVKIADLLKRAALKEAIANT